MNAELIAALRNCADYSDCGICKLNGKFNCADMMMRDAADALEAADKRIARLEDDLMSGTVSEPQRFGINGYSMKDLLLFAEMCKRNDVREADLKKAAWNIELAVIAVQSECMEIIGKWSDEMSNGVPVRFIPDFEKAFEEMMPNCGAKMKGKETDDGIHVRE